METQAGGLEVGEEGGKASHGGDGEEGEEDKASAYDCNVCGRSFPFQSSLSQHMRRHTGARPYKCPYCDHRASQKGNLKTAVRSVKREKSSSEQRPYCCRLCGYQTQREDQLLSHIEKVTDGAFPCETCGQVFTQAWFLKSHMKKHAGLLEHCCRVCGRRFREAWFLKSHMKTHNGSKASGRGKPRADSQEAAATINDVAQDPETNVTSTSLYQVCSKCGNLFHDRERGSSHHTSPGEHTPESLSDSEYRPSSRQGRRSSSSQQSQSKSTECFECGKVFRSRHQMIVHQRVHQRRDGGRGSGSGGDNRAGQGGDRWGSTSDPESGSPSRPSTPGYGNSPPASTLGEDAPEMGTANAVPLTG
ncbi:unnamed protein product [Oncorhynchus mykiss]|uniref:C2H2-type domain-containing protein n=1 Tax=Oncorhynchus mykiss TaxID=8022 RepID=A0A060Z877_ONCMY|nr:unnamed protein product [Oncorhynchus mykiss]